VSYCVESVKVTLYRHTYPVQDILVYRFSDMGDKLSYISSALILELATLAHGEFVFKNGDVAKCV
jgi:hypothetical protein